MNHVDRIIRATFLSGRLAALGLVGLADLVSRCGAVFEAAILAGDVGPNTGDGGAS